LPICSVDDHGDRVDDMNDNERRKWIAGLRRFDRVTYRWGLNYLRGCTLLERGLPSDDTSWFVQADASESGIEEGETHVLESELEPPPYPGFTGFLDIDPERTRPRRRRSRAKATKASA